MLGFVVFLVQLARHVAPKISDKRSLKLRKCPPQEQRVHARMQMRLINGFVQQCLSFPRPRSTAKQAVFRFGIVKFSLPVKWLVRDFLAEFFKAENAFLRERLVGLGNHEMMWDGLSSARFSLRGL